ncbi:LysR family transcriptional regulator [Candidatus Formimonas warabiya]|uniref:HTH lysR-type domain-containing protein n=1 Tax=Formimonas warabiya TaxID=1761012 RepID=A0A3G1KTS7_FORW1|nr:LysR family transcriptional regulator [Candidatus Formimonas warabiya]ATW25859.1 hypothetical protein DCMF_14750 [Candidatus Formimonas warabiya]
MNFHQMECFLTVVEEGGVSPAARKLYVSESSISQTIRKIETELGVTLFNRSSYKMTLTYAGKQYLQTVSGILQQHRNFLNGISGSDNNISGELSIWLSEKRAKDLLPKTLPVFMKCYPNVRIKIWDQRIPLDAREKLLLEGKCDLFISNHKTLINEIGNIPLCKEQLSLIVSKNSDAIPRLFPDGVITEKIPAIRLHGERLILLQRMYHGRILVDQIFHDLDIVPKIVMEVTYNETAKELAIAGIGCALSDEILIHDHICNIDRGDYYAVLIDHPFAKRDIVISYNKLYHLSSFHKAFIDIMIEQFN